MTGITSNIGLITGIPIAETVKQLVAVQARPRDLLAQRTEALKKEQLAITDLAARLLALQFTAENLKKPEIYAERSVSSSNPDALAATVTGEPALGSRVFTPLQAAQAHQLISSGIASDSAPLGAGEFSFRFGGFIDRGVSLDVINGGSGLARGKIRITDRSGASAEIDLRFARTVDDVLAAINSNTAINVTAQAVGDRLRLVDGTGQSAANLRVQEVAGGTTAAALGLAGIDVAASQADGTDILRLFNDLDLNLLNDGNGVFINDQLPDLEIEFRDGNSLLVDLRPRDSSTLRASGTTTAAAGIHARVTFTAVDTGSNLAGVQVIFQDDAAITAGNETVVYDATAKTLTFKIDAGNTTANQIVAALNNEPTANDFFLASLPAGGNGTGVIATSDTATTSLPSVLPADRTLGDVLASLNAAAPAKLRAELAASGDQIVLTDLTTGGGTFGVSSVFESTAAEDLGLTTAAAGGVITGRRLLGGLKSSLLATLGGGRGLGTLGALNLTDRSGATASVNLAAAQTLDDLVEAINNAPVAILAEVNTARNGIRLADVSGATASNLIVANGDATNTADKLQIAVNGAVNSIDSRSLRNQVISKSTLLSSLNGGAGVAKGSFRVFTTDGLNTLVNLTGSQIVTVGDVLDEINRLVAGVDARINDTGDGILIFDTLGGSKPLVIEAAGSQTAADLHILGVAKLATVDGQQKLAIDGSTTFKVTLDADDDLGDLVFKINQLGAGVTASSFNDGSAVRPYRLVLASGRAGAAGELLVDTSQAGFSLFDSARAQDSLLLLGSPDDDAVGVLAASSTREFGSIVPGLSLEVLAPAGSGVTITVEHADTDLTAGVKALVENFNSLHAKIAELTKFDEVKLQAGLLLGDAATLRVETDLARLLSGRFFGSSDIRSLETLGISLKDDGSLELDEDVFQEEFAARPQAVEDFFTKTGVGFADKLDQLIDQLAGDNNSLLSNRIAALTRRVEDNEERMEFLNERLERFRDRLLQRFFDLELAIGKIQSNLSVIQSLRPLPPLLSASQS